MKLHEYLSTASKFGIGLFLVGCSGAFAGEILVTEGYARGPLGGDRQVLRAEAFEDALTRAKQHFGCEPFGSSDCKQLRRISTDTQYTYGGGFTEETVAAKASFSIEGHGNALNFNATTEITGPKTLGRLELIKMLQAKLTDEVRFACGTLMGSATGPETISDLNGSEVNPDEIGLKILTPYQCDSNSDKHAVLGKVSYRSGGSNRCRQTPPNARASLEQRATQDAEFQCGSKVIQTSPWRDQVLECFEYGSNLLSANFQCEK